MRLAQLCAGAAWAFGATGALAQTVPSQPPPDPDQLDPNAPLAPLPDLGVEWPTLDPSDTVTKPVSVTTSRGKQATTNQVAGDLRYTIAVTGLTDIPSSADLLTAFRQQSTLESERKDLANAAQIGRRAAADADLLTELMHSRGYYDAVVSPRTLRNGAGLQVVFDVDPGAQYRFAAVSLPGLDAAGPAAASLRAAFAVKAGDPVVAEDVIAAGAALTHALGEQGFAAAALGDQDIEINHATRAATLVLPVDPGPVARFGAIRVNGKPPFGADHVGIMARFKPGDPFRQSDVDDLRRALIATTLVSSADIKLVPQQGGRIIDLAVNLEPAPSHTIAGEVGYGTGQGARVEASWTDRNFFNPEGALTLRGIAGTAEQLAGVQFRRANFHRRDQVLNAQFTVAHQKFDAYEAKTILLGANIERQSNFIWQKVWTYNYGAQFLGTDERGVFSPSGAKDTRKFAIAALPLSLGYDGSDSLLDPTRGFRLNAMVSPEFSLGPDRLAYGRVQVDASAYRPVRSGVVVAGRVRLGTIAGASSYDLAPSRRFYAGGGGSVRGYGYQQLGPKDMDGDPIGGRGLAEFALETRIRLKSFGGNFGVVPFFDGGSLTTEALPDLKNWRFAAGVGLRYYSSFGPIRIDLGVPLNRQKGDGPIAVAVSLGQAF